MDALLERDGEPEVEGQGSGAGSGYGCQRSGWARRAAITDWLVTEGRSAGDLRVFTDAFCRRLLVEGIPLWRLSLGLPVLHPLIRLLSVYWHEDRDGVEVMERLHGTEHSDAYRASPVALILDRDADALRFRVERLPKPAPHPILDDLRGEGATDYVIMGLSFAGHAPGDGRGADAADQAGGSAIETGRRGIVSLSSRRPGGFTTADLALLDGVRDTLATVLEGMMLHHLTVTLLDTYVGRRTGARVMSGEIRRGSLETLRAVIWYCDLRGFTALSDRLAPHDLIALLNGYFEIMAGAVESHGGEVLKFIGDAMLAVFPLPDVGSCVDAEAKVAVAAVDAAREALEGIERRNAERASWGEPVLRCGIALHLGDVLYGNIGAPTRLDFTVIGAGVNLVTRIEGLCKRLDRSILTSADFAAALTGGRRATPPCSDEVRERARLMSLGWHPVKGLRDPVEVYGL